jgi:hypothetical protein
VDDVEIKNGKTIPTYNLLNKYRQENPDKDFFFILGSDLLPGLKNWDDGEQLIAEFNFLIYSRVGFTLEEQHLPKNYILIQTTFVGASSSLVRERVKASYLAKKGEEFFDIDEIKPRASNPDYLKKKKTETQLNLEKKWLNIFGIVQPEIIEFIKVNSLYSD